MNEIANKIKETRLGLKMSQSELSSLSGVTKTTIYNIETGRQSCSTQCLLKLCKVLNLKIKIIENEKSSIETHSVDKLEISES